MSKVFDLWNEVGGAFGPSGREDAVRETIAGIAGAYIDDVTTDALGNLICRKKGAKDGRKVLFAAHILVIDTFGRDLDALTISFFQTATTAVLSWIGTLMEGSVDWSGAGQAWLAVVYAGVGSVGVA